MGASCDGSREGWRLALTARPAPAEIIRIRMAADGARQQMLERAERLARSDGPISILFRPQGRGFTIKLRCRVRASSQPRTRDDHGLASRMAAALYERMVADVALLSEPSPGFVAHIDPDASDFGIEFEFLG